MIEALGIALSCRGGAAGIYRKTPCRSFRRVVQARRREDRETSGEDAKKEHEERRQHQGEFHRRRAALA